MQGCTTFSPMDMAFSTLVPVPALAAMFYFLLKLVLLSLVEIRIFPTGVVFRSGLSGVRNEFYKDLQQNTYINPISCPMVSGKTRH